MYPYHPRIKQRIAAGEFGDGQAKCVNYKKTVDMKTKVYANFNAEIYEIMNEDGTYTGFQATDFQALVDTCEEHGFMLTHVDGSDD